MYTATVSYHHRLRETTNQQGPVLHLAPIFTYLSVACRTHRYHRLPCRNTVSGIILWELLVRKCPYEGMTAIQSALAVLNNDSRPEIPQWYVYTCVYLFVFLYAYESACVYVIWL